MVFWSPSKIIGGSPVSTPMIYIMIINNTYAYRGSYKSQNGWRTRDLTIKNLSLKHIFFSESTMSNEMYGCLVDYFGFNGPLRRYFSLYRTLTQNGRKKRETREKMSKQPPPAPTASAIGP